MWGYISKVKLTMDVKKVYKIYKNFGKFFSQEKVGCL